MFAEVYRAEHPTDAAKSCTRCCWCGKVVFRSYQDAKARAAEIHAQSRTKGRRIIFGPMMTVYRGANCNHWHLARHVDRRSALHPKENTNARP